MNLLQEIQSLVGEIEGMHMNDPRICNCWDKMIEILGRDEKKTIHFFEEHCDENMANHIAGNFPEISYYLQSQDFIITLKKLDNRFPHLNLNIFIKGAEETILDEQTVAKLFL